MGEGFYNSENERNNKIYAYIVRDFMNSTCVCPIILEVWVISASFLGFGGLLFEPFWPILVRFLWPFGIMDSSSVTKHTSDTQFQSLTP
jgi:hypothetical protein